MREVILGDCLKNLKEMKPNSIDMIYLDPPFFTQRTQKGIMKNTDKTLEFSDSWKSIDEYLDYIKVRIIEMKRVLKNTVQFFYIVIKLHLTI